MIKNTRNVRDLALAALDQVSGAGLPGLAGPRFDMLPPDLAIQPGFKLDLAGGCPACGVLGSDIGFDLGAELKLPR